MFGGNDDHGFMTGLPEGVELDGFAGPRWTAEYRRRVGGLMDTVTRSGAHLVWIGLPITDDVEQTRRFDAINALVQSEAAERKGRVSYLDTYFFFAGDDGGYAQYVATGSGRLVKMRADDGVHFERPAGDLIAREVLRRLNQRYDLTSWRRGSIGAGLAPPSVAAGRPFEASLAPTAAWRRGRGRRPRRRRARSGFPSRR